MSGYRSLAPVPWETRNLGVESFALSDGFVQAPDARLLRDEIARQTEQHGRIFVQARIDKADRAVIPLVQRQGFYFVESTLVPYASLNRNGVLQRFLESREAFLPGRYALEELRTGLADRSQKELCRTLQEIARTSFSDDRFHLDPHCDRERADARFFHWTEDLLRDAEVVFHILQYREQVVGFLARKAENLILAGFAKAYTGSGLGDYLWLSVLEDLLRGGFTQTHTVISANNTSVLNLYARLGFKFKNPAATFHYWSDPSGGEWQ